MPILVFILFWLTKGIRIKVDLFLNWKKKTSLNKITDLPQLRNSTTTGGNRVLCIIRCISHFIRNLNQARRRNRLRLCFFTKDVISSKSASLLFLLFGGAFVIMELTKTFRSPPPNMYVCTVDGFLTYGYCCSGCAVLTRRVRELSSSCIGGVIGDGRGAHY